MKVLLLIMMSLYFVVVAFVVGKNRIGDIVGLTLLVVVASLFIIARFEK
jgi:hypothetical protein